MRSFLALIRKDLKGYFDQPTGYILIVLLVAAVSWSFFNSAFLTQEASLLPLFSVDFVVERPSLPWLLALFFIPAATMRLLAEEQRDGTLEILLTQPIQGWVVLVAKFLTGFIFVSIAILATLSIPLTLLTAGTLDWGAVAAQYLGSLFLAASFIAIGLFTSSMTRNQIVAFIVALTITMVLMVMGLDRVGVLLPSKIATLLKALSPVTHFSSMARGLIDLRDVLYFIALVLTFLSAAFLMVRGGTLSHKTIQYRNLQLGVAGLIVFSLLVGWFGNSIGGRLDLTEDKLFTLSPGTKEIVSGLDDLLTIHLFESKDPPVQISLVARDVNNFLQDLAANSGGKVKVVHKFPDNDEKVARFAQLSGVPAVRFNVQSQGELTIKEGYLGLSMTYADQRKVIQFIDSIDGFEYRVATLAYSMVRQQEDRKTVAFLTGHGEKEVSVELQSLGGVLAQQYNVIEVEAIDDQPLDLSGVDILVIAGPTEQFPKNILDTLHQYMETGGRAMVLVDPIILDLQRFAGIPNQNSFAEFLERYGVFVEANLVFDLRSHERLQFDTQQGSVLLPYPYWARVPVADTNVTGNVENALMPWASSLGTTEGAEIGRVEVIPILRTTEFGAVDYNMSDLSPNPDSRTGLNVDVEESNLFEVDVAVAVEGVPVNGTNLNGGTFRLVVVGDSDWLTDAIATRAQENLALGLNLVDWLAQEETLAEIRSKVVSSRTLLFDSRRHENVVQYANILGVPLVFVAIGLLRYIRRRMTSSRVYRREK